MEGYYLLTEMAGTGHVYTRKITTLERVTKYAYNDSVFMEKPGTTAALGKVKFVPPDGTEDSASCDEDGKELGHAALNAVEVGRAVDGRMSATSSFMVDSDGEFSAISV
jgi:hypothetical protein